MEYESESQSTEGGQVVQFRSFIGTSPECCTQIAAQQDENQLYEGNLSS